MTNYKDFLPLVGLGSLIYVGYKLLKRTSSSDEASCTSTPSDQSDKSNPYSSSRITSIKVTKDLLDYLEIHPKLTRVEVSDLLKEKSDKICDKVRKSTLSNLSVQLSSDLITIKVIKELILTLRKVDEERFSKFRSSILESYILKVSESTDKKSFRINLNEFRKYLSNSVEL